MRKSLVVVGLVLFIVGIALGFYASQRNCLIAFVTSGHVNFWTAVEISGGELSVMVAAGGAGGMVLVRVGKASDDADAWQAARKMIIRIDIEVKCARDVCIFVRKARRWVARRARPPERRSSPQDRWRWARTRTQSSRSRAWWPLSRASGMKNLSHSPAPF